MIRNSYLFIIFSLVSCSLTTPQSPADLYKTSNQSIEQKSIQYPFLKTYFEAFLVLDQEPVFLPSTTVTPEMLARAKIFDVAEKRHMLKSLDLIKFAINTSEFRDKVLKLTVHSARNATGPIGTIKVGDVLDMNRVWEVLKNGQLNLTIHKQNLSLSAAAVGVVRPTHLHVTDLKYQRPLTYFIAFPNRNYYGNPDLLYLASVVFHELLHNMGYTHHSTSGYNDTVYGIQSVLDKLLTNPEWRAKYSIQLSQFTPFYEEAYKDWLISNSIPVASRQQTFEYSHDINSKSVDFTPIVYGPQDQELEICILSTDHSYRMTKM